jgi:hypothetical protein
MEQAHRAEDKAKCACPREDARDCYRYRYAPMDDIARADFFSIMDQDDDKCECVCHQEIEYDLNDDTY